MLQTLSSLGSLELCEPHPASSAQLCKSYPWAENRHFAAAEQHPVIQGRIDEAGIWTRSSETFFAAHEQRELYQ